MRPDYDNDREYLRSMIERSIGDQFRIYDGASMSIGDFLTSTTIKLPAVMIANMGFAFGEGRERGPGEPIATFSLFIHCGQPGATAARTKATDAEDAMRRIVATLSDEVDRTYRNPATEEMRTCTVSGGANLFLSHGFDVYEIQLTIN